MRDRSEQLGRLETGSCPKFQGNPIDAPGKTREGPTSAASGRDPRTHPGMAGRTAIVLVYATRIVLPSCSSFSSHLVHSKSCGNRRLQWCSKILHLGHVPSVDSNLVSGRSVGRAEVGANAGLEAAPSCAPGRGALGNRRPHFLSMLLTVVREYSIAHSSLMSC